MSTRSAFASATVARLSVAPIKGLALQHPRRIELTCGGAVGDRQFFLIDVRDALISIPQLGALLRFAAEFDPASNVLTLRRDDGCTWSGQTRLGEIVRGAFHDRDPVAGHVVEGPWSKVLSEAVGQPLRLLRALDGSAFDVHPATILGMASVAELERRAGLGPVDSRRFRMLIELHTRIPHVEDTWAGRRISIGEAELVVGGPVPRCAAVTRHPDRGERDAPIVAAIKAYRGVQEGELGPGVNFGVYADVIRPGAVAVGDRVAFLA